MPSIKNYGSREPISMAAADGRRPVAPSPMVWRSKLLQELREIVDSGVTEAEVGQKLLLLGKELSDDNSEQQRIVPLASSAVQPVGQLGGVPEYPALDQNMPRTRLGSALRPRKGHFVEIEPLLDGVRLYDETNGLDVLYKTPFFKLVNAMNLLCIGGMRLGLPFTIVWGPFALASATGADRLLLAAANASGTMLNRSSLVTAHGEEWTPPWGGAWAGFCDAALWMSCLSTSYLLAVLLTMSQSASTCRFILSNQRTRITLTLSLAVAYAVFAGVLVPTAGHQVWLTARTMVVAFVSFSDSIMVNFKLRYTPKRFSHMFGAEVASGKDSDKHRHGWSSLLLLMGGVGFVTCDFARHFAVLFVADRQEVFHSNLTNPLNGNPLAVSVHQLTDTLYFTSFVFTAGAIYRLSKTHLGAETIILSTRFRIQNHKARKD